IKIRDFTKKLLGRIVFLHFLQKKGWMGCPDKNSWGSGDKKFMQNLFKSYSDKEQFHSKCLAELFYNTLNAKRADNLFTCNGLEGALNNSKVPYLNGGLFDSDKVESKKIDFPEKYFEELFDFFGQYNFTIDENDPNDHEVGIDPEMLGHIFENLLEDNKDKGAFYTPKVIVQYMCQESLIEYLATKLHAEASGEVKQAIEDLIRNRLAEDISDLDLVEPIAQALYDVKICDPAIGSGAFPMGILNVIYQVIEALFYLQPDSVARVWNISDTEWQPHLVKKNIIQHSIYGVDIESGAVDIARLRFWLALVVDEVEPLPLPNLDYKIMQGNSLLESFEGIDLSQISDAAAYEAVYESEQIDMFSGEAKKKVTMSLNFEDVKTLMDEYFNANDPETKKDLHKRIDDQVLNHIHFTLSQHKKELKKKATKLEKKVRLDEAAARTWEQKEKIRTNSKGAKELNKHNKELAEYDVKENKLAQLYNSKERPFFLWHLFFQEVFENGGFDIVIANPPYVGEKGNKEIFRKVKTGFLSKYYKSKMDLFYFFFHLGLDFSKNGGVLCFISTNYFLTADGALNLRNDFKSRSQVLALVNFNEFKIFDSALGQHNIITLLKKSTIKTSTKLINVNSEGFYNYSKLNRILNKVDADTAYLVSSTIYDGDESYIRIGNKKGDKNFELLEKIKSNKNLLPYYVDINSGCDITLSKISPSHIKSFPKLNLIKGQGVFVLSELETKLLEVNEYENSRLVDYVKNSHIKSYSHVFSSDKLIYNSWDSLEKNIPNFVSHLSAFKEIMLDQIKRYDEPTWPWYALHRPRERGIFESNDKILVPYRSKINSFAFSDTPVYSSRDVFFLIKKNKDDSLIIRKLLAVLNSKLIYFWLYHRGKRKGATLELYSTPLSQIPIAIPFSNKIVSLVDQQIVISKKNGEFDEGIQNQIDTEVYKTYGLTYDEVIIVDNNYKLSQKEYNDFETPLTDNI
ncbi:MAG: TaqI-like C-terminal specificity domain-containing protein, partial [Maribacter arcticus]|uniref:Eco57I restriction-modification methylase domain-containing protein n=1 Tax=Maribacter arcticus TaxID=561365 RepID=UPI003001FBDE